MAEVLYLGPFFDGRAEKAVEQATRESEKQIAVLGAVTVRDELSHVLRVETPYYRLRNQARKEPAGWKISDAGVIYGPWLEGTGSRNKTTRFKGYATYRRMTQKIQEHAVAVADAVFARFDDRWN